MTESPIATLKPIDHARSGSVPSVGPIVLIDGRVEPQFWVTAWHQAGPIDRRTAALAMSRSDPMVDSCERADAERWRGRTVTLVQPTLLAGLDSRLMPLLAGRIAEIDMRVDAENDVATFDVIDDFSVRLDQPLDPTAFEAPTNDADASERALIEAGQWSVSLLIRRINELGVLGLKTDLLDRGITAQTVHSNLLNGNTIGSVLERVLTEHDVLVQRSMRWDGHGVSETRHLRAAHHQRPISLGLSHLADPGTTITAIDAAMPAPPPVKLIAEADGAVVESTFDLVGGWDPALQSLPDSEYVRSTSVEFDAVANVFRLWVLNEDGAFTEAPFNRGSAFDLTGLFDDGRLVPPRPLPFGDAMSLTEPDISVGVVTDISINSGSSWSRYPGQVVVSTERAGVYLDDDTLPAGFVAAVRAGTARVRVTASMQSPHPLTQSRWRGNPFAGAFETRRLRVGNLFRHRRLSANSKYFNEVASGQRRADTTDDRPAMAHWLTEQAEKLPRAEGSLDLRTAGLQIALRPGDRLIRIAGRRIGGDLYDPAAPGPAAHLDRIDHDLTRNTSRLRWRVV